jgi:hypothetical protein
MEEPATSAGREPGATFDTLNTHQGYHRKAGVRVFRCSSFQADDGSHPT